MNQRNNLEQIKIIINLIKNKKIEEVEKELNDLLENTEKVEINKYGRVFDFENQIQFVLYCNTKETKGNVQWDRTYISEMYYYKGIIEFEKRNYTESIQQLKKSLKWNPVKVSAYNELLENYIKLNDFTEFEETFKKSLKIVTTPLEVSILYKKYAFFCIERKEYELAYNILKYTALIYPRKENEEEIDYLSSICKVKLPKFPDLGTIQYIREHDLEYKANDSIINTYLSLAQLFEQELKKDTTIEQKKMYLEKLVDIYTKLYFFKCENNIHNLLMDTIRKLLETT